MMSGSTAVAGGGGTTGAGAGTGRLRLADLRRQEEEMMRARGRQSMQSEWSGNGGYDGYTAGHYGGSGAGAGERYYAQPHDHHHQDVGLAR